jgi:hypothetical protein
MVRLERDRGQLTRELWRSAPLWLADRLGVGYRALALQDRLNRDSDRASAMAGLLAFQTRRTRSGKARARRLSAGALICAPFSASSKIAP